MASDPRKRGCPLPSVSPARPGRLEGGAAGTERGRGGSVAPRAAPRGYYGAERGGRRVPLAPAA